MKNYLGLAVLFLLMLVLCTTQANAESIAKARAELGYAPTIGLSEGIRRTLDWYREHRWL